MADPYLDHLIRANQTFAEQIKVADQKAAYVFTFVLALMVWSGETRRALNLRHLQSIDALSLAVTLALLTAIVVALCSAICVVLPRSRPGRSVMFWGAWPEAGKRLSDARAACDPSFVEDDIRGNTETLAAICAAKYRLVKLSFRAILVLVIAYVALLILPAA